MNVLAIVTGLTTLASGTNVEREFDAPAEASFPLPDPLLSWVRPVDSADITAFRCQAGFSSVGQAEEEEYHGVTKFNITYTCASATDVEFWFVWTDRDQSETPFRNYEDSFTY
jgi:hypothetical protein